MYYISVPICEHLLPVANPTDMQWIGRSVGASDKCFGRPFFQLGIPNSNTVEDNFTFRHLDIDEIGIGGANGVSVIDLCSSPQKSSDEITVIICEANWWNYLIG